MNTFAFATTANNERYRAIAANLIFSSQKWGEYTWYLVADKPLNIGERFVQMPVSQQASWNRKENVKHLTKYEGLRLVLEAAREDYVVLLDADCVFRGAPPIQRLLDEDRHAFALLEGNLLAPENGNREWFMQGHKRRQWLDGMSGRHPGVFYNLNGGFLGVRKSHFREFMFHVDVAIGSAARTDPACILMMSEEPYTSYAIHQMNENLDGLLIDRNLDIFLYTGAYPDDPKSFDNWGTGLNVPAPKSLGIVHIFNKHDLLADDGRRRMASLGKAL